MKIHNNNNILNIINKIIYKNIFLFFYPKIKVLIILLNYFINKIIIFYKNKEFNIQYCLYFNFSHFNKHLYLI
jgi:hypothetical protein